jgi:hypothetical protein
LGEPEPEAEPVGHLSDVIVVEERSLSRDGLFAVLALLLLGAPASAVLRGGPHDTDDVVAMAVLAVLGLGIVAVGIFMRLHPRSVLVSDDAIRLVQRSSSKPPQELTRSFGNRIAFVLAGSARSRHWTLTNVAGEPRLSLQFFNKKQVERACRARGWTFGENG